MRKNTAISQNTEFLKKVNVYAARAITTSKRAGSRQIKKP